MTEDTQLSEDTPMQAAPSPTFNLPVRETPVAAGALHQPAADGAQDEPSSIQKSFALPKYFKPATVKLDNIELLEGQHNYEDWASQIAMVFDAMSVHDIVIEGVEPSANASPSELQGYQALSNNALLILIQVISKPILKKVSKYKSPHAIWKYLKETYYRDSALSFVLQVAGLCLLSTKFEKGKPVSELIDKFDDQWNRVYEMTTGSDPYHQKVRAFLEEDYVKRDFLLAALSEHYPNLVANLTTKVDLTYAEARHHLNSLSSNNQLGDKSTGTTTTTATTSGTTLVTGNNKQTRRRSRWQPKGSEHTSSQPPSTNTKVCTYCKRYGGTAEGHLWQDCRKLKCNQKRKRNAAPNYQQT